MFARLACQVSLICIASLSALGLSACNKSDATLNTPGNHLALPNALREVSGLAALADGTLLLHNDELGLVYRLTYETGAIQEFASLGEPAVQGDFEGIATLADQLYLLTSKGVLYSRSLTAPSSKPAFRKHKTGLKKVCEFEGLEAMTDSNLLVLLCKQPKEKRDKGYLLIYFWSPATQAIEEDASLRIDLSLVGSRVHPSGIHRIGDNFIVVAAKERLILRLSQSGKLLSFGQLPNASSHPQTEGIAIVGEYLYLADESVDGKPATVRRYPLEQLDNILTANAN